MSDDTKAGDKTDGNQKSTADHEPPAGASVNATWNGLDYTATANWLVLRKNDKPLAEVFSISYVAQPADHERPVTFVFNGGPGAASAYLHMGLVGPQRVQFPADGTLPPMPPKLVTNNESWLAFTDIVFVDPVGTGFSRLIDPAAKNGGAAEAKTGPEHNPNEYYTVSRDLEAMCEWMGRWLSENGRWGSPVFMAGESYGGYRVGRLTRMVQETAGIGLSGSILISPALEPAHLAIVLGWGEYEVAPWIDLIPTMAAAAAHHGRSRAFAQGTPVEEVQAAAEEFAITDYASFLASGAAMPEAKRTQVLQRLADLIGLDPAFVVRVAGRIRVDQFARELLRDERRVIGRYDAAISAVDPFPDRDLMTGADPTLTGLNPIFMTAVNQQLRHEIGVVTDREYKLLNTEITLAWKNDEAFHYIQQTAGAVDDFRYGMAMNPHLKAFITHGRYDLMTPYYASDRLRNQMRLEPDVADRLTVQHFDGGHMFYSWQESRQAFSAAIKAFMADALGR